MIDTDTAVIWLMASMIAVIAACMLASERLDEPDAEDAPCHRP